MEVTVLNLLHSIYRILTYNEGRYLLCVDQYAKNTLNAKTGNVKSVANANLVSIANHANVTNVTSVVNVNVVNVTSAASVNIVNVTNVANANVVNFNLGYVANLVNGVAVFQVVVSIIRSITCSCVHRKMGAFYDSIHFFS